MRNISQLEVRLLVVFDALMAERSATRAGRRLGLSQPAVSNALHRLRSILGDELFHRTSDSMLPTPRAIELAVPVGQVLRQIESAMEPAKFSPSESNRSFRLAISPPVGLVMLPGLAKRLETAAPGVQVQVRSTPSMQAVSMLDSQAVDMVIGVMKGPPKRYPSRVLYRDTYVALMRADHKMSRQKFSLERFAALDHVLVSQTTQIYNLFDDAIAQQGMKRNIRITTTDWLAAAEIIGTTDLVTAIFKRTADVIMKSSRRRLTVRPIRLPPFDIVMLWHNSFSTHPAYEWLQETIAQSC